MVIEPVRNNLTKCFPKIFHTCRVEFFILYFPRFSHTQPVPLSVHLVHSSVSYISFFLFPPFGKHVLYKITTKNTIKGSHEHSVKKRVIHEQISTDGDRETRGFDRNAGPFRAAHKYFSDGENSTRADVAMFVQAGRI
jgi:hypothetical protein